MSDAHHINTREFWMIFIAAPILILIGVALGVSRGPTEEAKATAYIEAKYKCPIYVMLAGDER